MVELRQQFQSLLGFLMRCDLSAAQRMQNNTRVSIPAGFSDALRPTWAAASDLIFSEFQSLLGFLMRCDLRELDRYLTSFFMFQSLLGFLMRCDIRSMLLDMRTRCSFNPCWVF